MLISAVGGSFRNNIDCFVLISIANVLISIANDNYRNKNAGNVLFLPKAKIILKILEIYCKSIYLFITLEQICSFRL